jgi:hypothetical protein
MESTASNNSLLTHEIDSKNGVMATHGFDSKIRVMSDAWNRELLLDEG